MKWKAPSQIDVGEFILMSTYTFEIVGRNMTTGPGGIVKLVELIGTGVQGTHVSITTTGPGVHWPVIQVEDPRPTGLDQRILTDD